MHACVSTGELVSFLARKEKFQVGGHVMNKILSHLGQLSFLTVLLCVITVAVSFYVSSYNANAQDCDAWVDYFVDEDGRGTCTVGIGAADFLNGTGVAKCAFAKNGNINCTCHGQHEIPLDSALIFNEEDNCCVYIGAEDPIESENTFGLGTPGGIVNATCKVRPE